MTGLVQCSACNRPIKKNETECPFCRAAVAPDRALVAVVVVSASLLLASCTQEVPAAGPTDSKSSQSKSTSAPNETKAPPQAHDAPEDAGRQRTWQAPPYGAPPVRREK